MILGQELQQLQDLTNLLCLLGLLFHIGLGLTLTHPYVLLVIDLLLKPSEKLLEEVMRHGIHFEELVE